MVWPTDSVIVASSREEVPWPLIVMSSILSLSIDHGWVALNDDDYYYAGENVGYGVKSYFYRPKAGGAGVGGIGKVMHLITYSKGWVGEGVSIDMLTENGLGLSASGVQLNSTSVAEVLKRIDYMLEWREEEK